MADPASSIITQEYRYHGNAHYQYWKRKGECMLMMYDYYHGDEASQKNSVPGVRGFPKYSREVQEEFAKL